MSDDWSAPKIYGTPMPLPGDGSALAVETSQPDSAGDGWSPANYHGPRRHRPASHAVGSPDRSVQASSAHDSSAHDSSAQDGSEFSSAVKQAERPVPDHDAFEQTEGPAANAGNESSDRGAPARAGAPSLMASSRTMAIASLASRVTGFIRSLVLVAALGIGLSDVADAYNLANTLPNMVYELLLGGVLASVIIPVLVQAQHDDDDQGLGYTQRLLSLATAVLGGATVLAVLAAPLLASIFGGSASKQALTGLWATLLLPEIFFYGLGAMFTAVLNTRDVYGWPAWAPVLNNIITVVAVGLFLLMPSANPLTASSISAAQILVLGIGTTLGIAGQALVLLIPLRKSGFTWKWRFRALPTEVGRMAEFRTLTTWVLGYVAISQVGVFAVNRVANVRRGGPSTFANADLLFQVPYGILGVSLLTALMPRMSRAAARGDTGSVLDDLRLGTRLSAVALIPVTAGLIVLGPEFTSVIFVGHAHLDEARLIGVALAAGSFGLLPFALVMLQLRVFYAMRNARTPTMINLAMVATKVALVFGARSVLHGNAIIIALTVSTSLSYLVGSVVGHFLLRRTFGPLGFGRVLRTLGWISVAAGAGAVVALVVVLAGHSAVGTGRLAALVELVVGGGLGAVVLAVLAVRLPLPEVAEIVGAVRGRSGRPADTPSDQPSA